MRPPTRVVPAAQCASDWCVHTAGRPEAAFFITAGRVRDPAPALALGAPRRDFWYQLLTLLAARVDTTVRAP